MSDPDRFEPDAALIPIMAPSEVARLGLARDEIARLESIQAGYDFASEYGDSADAAVASSEIQDRIDALGQTTALICGGDDLNSQQRGDLAAWIKEELAK